MHKYIVSAVFLGIGGIAALLRGRLDIDSQTLRNIHNRLEKQVIASNNQRILTGESSSSNNFSNFNILRSGHSLAYISDDMKKPRAIDHGIDTDCSSIQGLEDLGYTWIIIGPATYQETPITYERSKLINRKDYPDTLGVRLVKGQLVDLRKFSPQKFENHQIGVSIVPSEEIIVHTPYLIIEDLVKSVAYASSHADFIVLNITENYLTYSEKFRESPLIDGLIDRCYEEMERTAKRASRPLSKLFLRFGDNNISRKFYENPKIHGFILPQAPKEIPLDLPSKTIISEEDGPNTHVILQKKLFL